MEYVVSIVLALASLGAGDLGLASGPPRWIALAALVVVPHALAYLARAALYRGRFRVATWLERALAVSPLAMQVLAVTRLGWASAVGAWTGLGLLLGVVPFVVLQVLALHARTRIYDPRSHDRDALFALQARLFLSTLVPFAAYVGLSALLGASAELRVRLEEVSLYNALFTLALLGGFLVLLPSFLRNTWVTTPLREGAVRGVLEDVAQHSGFRYKELLLWHTGSQMANAAIVGFTPRSRVVLFSDALLSQLGPRELAAVFAHEIGHARRHHAAVFIAFVLIVFVGAELLLDWTPIEGEAASLAVLFGLLGVWYVAFGYLSRRFELDADLSSLEVIGDPAPLSRALLSVTGAHAHERDGWRHFSTARRVRFLHQAAADPAIGRRLRRRLYLWSVVGVVLACGLSLVRGVRLVQERAAEEVVADLRLGHWSRAQARLDADVEVDPELRAIVQRAQRLDPGQDAEAIERIARAAARLGDWQATAELLQLAVLRGNDALRRVVNLVADLALAGRVPGVSPAPGVESGVETGSESEPDLDERIRALGEPWRGLLGGG